MKTFEDIIAWQKSQDLTARVYHIFDSLRDFGFRDQICRAAVSVSNNIAEGFERGSEAEFRRFLFIAKGSAAEVRSMAHTAQRLAYITESESSALREMTIEISHMIRGFIASIGKTKSKLIR